MKWGGEKYRRSHEWGVQQPGLKTPKTLKVLVNLIQEGKGNSNRKSKRNWEAMVK